MYNDIFSIGSFTIHGYGLMIGIGFLLAVLMGSYRAKRRSLDSGAIVDLAILILLFGFIGGKILYIIVEFRTVLSNPIMMFASDGFVVYGGIFSGMLTAWIYCHIKKMDFLGYFDVLFPAVALNQAFGRIGCFLAGCCFGRETSCPIGVVFPEGSLAPAGIRLVPTQLLSSAGDFLICGILIWYSNKTKWKGNVAALYLILYGVGRFIIEIFRADARGSIGMLSTSQFISIFIVIGGIAFYLFNRKRAIPVLKVNNTDAKIF